jgi:hypothetical protein
MHSMHSDARGILRAVAGALRSLTYHRILDCSIHAKHRGRQPNLPALFLAAILSELKINKINLNKFQMNTGIGGASIAGWPRAMHGSRHATRT